MDNTFWQGVNPQQQEAVTYEDGHLLILAGAGSGKTRTLTHRIAYLVHARQLPLEAVLAVTFTNKAAREMEQRLQQLLDTRQRLPWVGTFHSICARVLRRFAPELGYDHNFSIYDDTDQQRLLKDILQHQGHGTGSRDKYLKQLRSYIDRSKNRGLTPEEMPPEEDPEGWQQPLYQLYQQRLQQAQAMDFGDLLLQMLVLLQQNSRVRTWAHNLWQHIYVDEFQDTNAVQYRLVCALAAGGARLCVVGDDDQAIYGWRGAQVDNILGFADNHQPCKVLRLEQNYRSTQAILDAAGSVVAQNQGRLGKALWTHNQGGQGVCLETLSDDRAEARYVVEQLQQLCRQGYDYGDMACFYRTNAQSRVLEEALAQQGIAYTMVGGVRFYARAEIKDLLAYLRLLVNPADTVAARRIINTPSRGIGASSLQRLEAYTEEAGGLLPACYVALQKQALKGAAAKRVQGFCALFDAWQPLVAQLPPAELAQRVMEQSGYALQLRESSDPQDQERLQNLQQLLAGMEEFSQAPGSLADFLEQIALVTDVDQYQQQDNRVTLMTLHAAKGLEFPVVFMTGMEEGLFPLQKAAVDAQLLEEERRLCYVGMTRAQQRLYMTAARRRRIYGSYQYNAVSRFVQEIPAPLQQASAAEAAGQSQERPGHNLAAVLQQLGEVAPEASPQPASSQEAVASAPAAEPPPEVEVVPEAEEGLRRGMRVQHPKFGLGTVRRLEGQGQQQKVQVAFDRYGYKKLLVCFSGLEPAS